MEEGLHVLLQDMVTKLFDIEAQVIRVCEGGRSATVCALDKGARTTTFLRNRRFMDYDPKFKEDRDFAMAAVQGMVGGGHCLLWKQIYKRVSGYAGSAVRRTGRAVSGILKGMLSKLTHSSSSTATLPRRKAVSWAPSVGA